MKIKKAPQCQTLVAFFFSGNWMCLADHFPLARSCSITCDFPKASQSARWLPTAQRAIDSRPKKKNRSQDVLFIWQNRKFFVVVRNSSYITVDSVTVLALCSHVQKKLIFPPTPPARLTTTKLGLFHEIALIFGPPPQQPQLHRKRGPLFKSIGKVRSMLSVGTWWPM